MRKTPDPGLPPEEIQILEWQRSPLQRTLGRVDLIVRGSLARDPIVHVNVSRATALRVVDQILAKNPGVWLQPELEDAFMRHLEAPLRQPVARAALVPLVIVAMLIIAIGLKGDDAPPVAYPPDDAILPGGQKRPTAEIIAFMESEVMPFAREVLGPLVGGADQVRCETCHGLHAQRRDAGMARLLRRPPYDFTKSYRENRSRFAFGCYHCHRVQ